MKAATRRWGGKEQIERIFDMYLGAAQQDLLRDETYGPGLTELVNERRQYRQAVKAWR